MQQDKFFKACYKGELNIAKNLLIDNSHINISANDEYAFRLACEQGHLNIAQWLLHINPDINISVQNESSFRWACAYGRLEIAKWLLEMRPQINISVCDEEAFKLACLYGHLKVAEWLQILKPYLYTINYNADGTYQDYYIRSKKEARWQQTKYLIWLSSPHSPNVNSVFYKLPCDISRYIIQNFI